MLRLELTLQGFKASDSDSGCRVQICVRAEGVCISQGSSGFEANTYCLQDC